VRYAVVILIATLVAALAGYRAFQLRSVQAVMPQWMPTAYWFLIGALFVTVPIIWWLDL
jgi:hypothetical protein